MFSTDFIFRQQENLVDNQKSQAGFRPLRNKILFFTIMITFLQWSHQKLDTKSIQFLVLHRLNLFITFFLS